jgi:TPR repeat protein
MYRNGRGVAANPAVANDLLARSASQGYSDALKLIQAIENFGYEIDEDLHRGPAHLEQLASDGDAEAAYQLAMRYENGAYGVAQNNEKALYWFKKAAASGSTQAMTSLADIYAKGLLGVKPDAAAAQKWKNRVKSDTPH